MTSEKQQQPRVLVTGGNGFIGRALVQRLIDEGQPVRLFARRAPATTVEGNPLVEVVHGDLSEPGIVDRAVHGVEVVYHLGAAMAGSPGDFDRSTVRVTANIIDSCVRHGVHRLVYISSLSLIDSDAGQDGRPIDENAPVERRAATRGHYTRSKAEAEGVVRQAAESRGLPVVLLRPGEVIGSGRPLLTPGVAQRVGRLLVVIGDGRLKLPLIHVEDVVDAMLAASRAPLEPGTIIQLVEDCGLTQNDIINHYKEARGYRVVHVPRWMVLAVAGLVETVCRWTGRPEPINRQRIRAATAQRTFDCRKARRLLDWNPRTGVRAALAGSHGPGATAAIR